MNDIALRVENLGKALQRSDVCTFQYGRGIMPVMNCGLRIANGGDKI